MAISRTVTIPNDALSISTIRLVTLLLLQLFSKVQHVKTSGLWIVWSSVLMLQRKLKTISIVRLEKEPTFMDCLWKVPDGTLNQVCYSFLLRILGTYCWELFNRVVVDWIWRFNSKPIDYFNYDETALKSHKHPPLGMIADSRLKELTPPMPVMFIKAVTVDRQDTKNVYDCPVYKTRERGPTFVWTFNLKTKEKPAKWTVAGVALLLAS